MERTKEEILKPHIFQQAGKVNVTAALEAMEIYKDQELSTLQAKYDEECLLRHMDQVALGHKKEDYDLSVENYDKLMVSYEALQAKYDNLKKTFQELVFVHSPRNKQTRIGWYIKAWLENQD